MKSLLEHLIQILTEAPMSDEDRKDSEQLRQIFKKRQNRSNARLSSDEIDLLNKYNIDLDHDSIMFPDKQSQYMKAASFNKNYMNPDVNLADKLRKVPERRYSQAVDRITTWHLPGDALANQAGKGSTAPDEYSPEYDKWSNLNWQEKERVYNFQRNDKYGQATQNMKDLLWDKKWNQEQLDDYYKQKDEIDQEYRRKLNDLNKNNSYRLERRDQLNKNIDDLKNQFKK